MRMPATNMNELFQRYYNKAATPAETDALMRWMADPANEQELAGMLRAGWEGLEQADAVLEPATSEAVLTSILPGDAQDARQAAVYRLWPRVAAAVILLLLCGGAYLLLTKNRGHEIAAGPAKPLPATDVPPGSNKAVLTLANGSTIVLDNAGKGLLAQQGATAVNKTAEGQLAYNTATAGNEAVGYNVVSTPRGGEYQVVLPDGSRVWLNAASSLRFPTAFSGTERSVELTGEAYFEIARNREKPFYVKLHNMQVQVLGTHFNVMGYDDEGAIKTSLLEGSVKVSQADSQVVLQPSQQASLDKEHGQLAVDKNAGIEKAVAWKDGLFIFENDDIKTIMRQLSRWYDVKVEYTGAGDEHYYTGQIYRQVPISQVLHMLQLVGGVSFSIAGNTITVKQH